MSRSSRRDSAKSTSPFLHGTVSPTNPAFSPTPSASQSDEPLNPSNVSLSVNYLPSKFSSSMLAAGPRRRKPTKNPAIVLPKRGGGVDAFRAGESRMPDSSDDLSARDRPKRRLRWNRFKWTLFAANLALTLYSISALILLLLTWFNVWADADIIRVGNRSELVISTVAASLGTLTALIGWAGILLNNRSFLAIYTFLLWVVFAFVVAPGYMTYKRRALNLEGKINLQWSRYIDSAGRLRVQNHLGCCGYYSPFVEATASQTCYARSVLPGCKREYMRFQRSVLKTWYTASFALIGPHMLVMVAGLLCSNHVTYRFGKGMMPKAYRLTMDSMAVIVDNYTLQLAESYGESFASDVVEKSQMQLNLKATDMVMVDMPHALNGKAVNTDRMAYDTVARPPPSPGSSGSLSPAI